MADSTMNTVSSAANNTAKNASRAITDSSTELRKTANDVYHSASDMVARQYDDLRRQGKEILEAVEGRITRQPFLALAVAVGAGVAAGLIVKGLFSRSK